LHVEWPCASQAEFDALWRDVIRLLREQNLAVGRGAYAGWDDADPALARAVWCISRHLRPEKVVETGVARGVTTRFLLEALERNGRGALWSIDLPPVLERELRSETAAAVPESCRRRWQYLEGSSRRRLPQLLAELGEIDLFVHDSFHTERNLRFELDLASASIARHGVLVADDVHRNAAFAAYAGPGTLVCPSDDRAGLFGIIVR
jgi:predicted O-methyltransferase YrrM